MIERKSVKTKRRAWKGVVSNMRAFGWVADEATEYEERSTSVTGYDITSTSTGYHAKPNYETSVERYVIVNFHRDTSWYSNLGAVKVIETFYNISNVLRKILGKLLWFGFGAALLFMVILGSYFGSDELTTKISIAFGVTIGAFLLFFIAERILISSAKATLKTADGQSAAAITGGDYGENMSTGRRVFISLLTVFVPFVGGFIGLAVGSEVLLAEIQVLCWIFLLLMIVSSLFLTVLAIFKLWKKQRGYPLLVTLDFFAPLIFAFLLMAFMS